MAASPASLQFELSVHTWDDCPDELRQLRHDVFVDEQKVPPDLEWDETDAVAEHFLVRNASGAAIAAARLFADGEDGRIGRMAVSHKYRGSGAGLWLLRKLMSHGCSAYRHFVLSAQAYAIPFYQRAGFLVCSEPYQDAGIPHRSMRCTAAMLVLNQPAETEVPLHLEQDTTSWQLQSHADWNGAIDALASQARQRFWLYEPKLDGSRYNREFLRDALSMLARRSRYSEVRFIVAEDKSLVEHHHRLTDLIRRLPSHVQLRVLNAELPEPSSSFALADAAGVAYRHEAPLPRGFANFNAPGRVRSLEDEFQRLWSSGKRSPELRSMLL
ncbi:MAG: GNAT family N-acetyltransferase [Alteromonadaceae bacterium]|nr:GNAT family N-acetyltransferase [Alteromonadaceae bacterium]|tara:strand:+ start:3616 stop:4599 length:984 start_codon:yes stop_codon:yes gene_type:complete